MSNKLLYSLLFFTLFACGENETVPQQETLIEEMSSGTFDMQSFYDQEISSLVQVNGDLSLKLVNQQHDIEIAQVRHDRDNFEKILLVVLTAAITVITSQLLHSSACSSISFDIK